MLFRYVCLFTAAFGALLSFATNRANAAYTNSSLFFSQVSGQTIVSFPSYTITTQDSFGITGPLQVNTSGQLTGEYGCNSQIFPCSGAYRLTYTLPFAIIGFEGNLQYNQAYGHETPIFSVPLGVTSGINYNGFYGDIFGPTNAISLVWRAGITSTDDSGYFTLSSASVVLAPAVVPEPASIVLLAVGIAVCGAVRRRSV